MQKYGKDNKASMRKNEKVGRSVRSMITYEEAYERNKATYFI